MWSLTMSRWDLSSLGEVSARVILFHLIYLSCVRKAFQLLSVKLNREEIYMEFLFVLTLLLFLSFCLQMTDICFSGPRKEKLI